MPTEDNIIAGNEQVPADNNTPGVQVNKEVIVDYDHSDLNQKKPENKENTDLLFGKFKSIDDAQKGYKSAEAKIREQGSEINKFKEELEKYKPMEEITPEAWSQKVESWKQDKSLPGDLNYDASIPEIDMLLHGFKTAGLSESQAKQMLAGAVQRQIQMVQEKQESIKKDLGEEGMKKLSSLQEFANKLQPQDKTVLASLFTFPYVEKEQVDLMYRLLCNQSEKSIPTNTSPASTQKNPEDIYNAIRDFRKTHSTRIDMDPSLQKQEMDLWADYDTALKRNR